MFVNRLFLYFNCYFYHRYQSVIRVTFIVFLTGFFSVISGSVPCYNALLSCRPFKRFSPFPLKCKMVKITKRMFFLLIFLLLNSIFNEFAYKCKHFMLIMVGFCVSRRDFLFLLVIMLINKTNLLFYKVFKIYKF